MWRCIELRGISHDDDVAYWLTIVSVYFLVGVLFFYSGKEKLFDGDAKAPPGIARQFDGTFVATFPGVDALWAILSVLEFAVFVILLVSLIRGEFLPHRRKSLLLTGLALGLLTFLPLVRTDLDRQQRGHRLALHLTSASSRS